MNNGNYWAFQLNKDGSILNYTAPRFASSMSDTNWIKVADVEGFNPSNIKDWKVINGKLVNNSGASTGSADQSEIDDLKSQINNLTFQVMKLTNPNTTES